MNDLMQTRDLNFISHQSNININYIQFGMLNLQEEGEQEQGKYYTVSSWLMKEFYWDTLCL